MLHFLAFHDSDQMNDIVIDFDVSKRRGFIADGIILMNEWFVCENVVRCHPRLFILI